MLEFVIPTAARAASLSCLSILESKIAPTQFNNDCSTRHIPVFFLHVLHSSCVFSNIMSMEKMLFCPHFDFYYLHLCYLQAAHRGLPTTVKAVWHLLKTEICCVFNTVSKTPECSHGNKGFNYYFFNLYWFSVISFSELYKHIHLRNRINGLALKMVNLIPSFTHIFIQYFPSMHTQIYLSHTSASRVISILDTFTCKVSMNGQPGPQPHKVYRYTDKKIPAGLYRLYQKKLGSKI